MQDLLNKAKELMQWAERYGIDEISITNGSEKIHLSKNGVAASNYPLQASVSAAPVVTSGSANLPPQEVPKVSPSSSFKKVVSPMVGTFYKAPGPDAQPFKKEGDRVQAGDTVCIVEAMKIMNQIKSPHEGILRKILVNNSEVVLKDQVLMEIEPA
jgi:acetyl-CoA carboxylase biotin carboxyl carrier protein